MQKAQATLKAAMTEQGRSARAVARMLDMNENTLRSMLNGHRRLDPEVALKVTLVLGVSRAKIVELIESDAAASVPSEVA